MYRLSGNLTLTHIHSKVIIKATRFMSEKMQFPPIVSSEDETRATLSMKDATGKFVPCEFNTKALAELMWGVPMHTGVQGHMTNGGLIYFDSHGPEVAKPECENPFELVTYSIAMDDVYQDVMLEYAKRLSIAAGQDVMLFIHRRVADGNEAGKRNTWACHDNASIPESLGDSLYADMRTQNDFGFTGPGASVLLNHLFHRSFISGAGLVTANGLRYAQKIDDVEYFNGYAYKSSHFRFNKDHGSRLEIRSGDRNVNNAAHVMRVGGVAIVAALIQTPLVQELDRKISITNPSNGKYFNGLNLTPEGTITQSDLLTAAVDSERRLMDYAIERLPSYMDVPAAYLAIAGMRHQFCQDFLQVMNGQATIELLADRSDWARKMGLVIEYAKAEPKNSMTDSKARAIDRGYDLTRIGARGEAVGARHGAGVTARMDTTLPCTPDAESVDWAKTHPPNTRAEQRSRHYRKVIGIKKGSWEGMIVVESGQDRFVAFYPSYAY